MSCYFWFSNKGSHEHFRPSFSVRQAVCLPKENPQFIRDKMCEQTRFSAFHTNIYMGHHFMSSIKIDPKILRQKDKLTYSRECYAKFFKKQYRLLGKLDIWERY